MNLKDLPVILTTILFLPCSLSAQSSSIQTDRPDQTESPFIVPAKYLQIETGVQSEQVNSNEQNILLPTTLIKYGFNDKFEFRLIADIYSHRINDSTSIGLNPIVIGSCFHPKVQLHGWVRLVGA